MSERDPWAIVHEQTRPGFEKWHLNRYGQMPWGDWYPVFHVLTEGDPHPTLHDHKSPGQGMWVQIIQGEGYVEDIEGVGLVTRRLGDRYRIDYWHRIVKLLSPRVITLAEYDK